MSKFKGMPNWLIGCGVGCGIVLLVFIALGVGGVFFLSETVSGFEEAVKAGATLEERFGHVEEFRPAADGFIPQSRMQAFLAVRDSTMPQRDRVAEAFNGLPMSDAKARELEDQPFSEKLGSIFRITSSAMGLGARIGDFFAARNQAMLEEEMGFGEYSYIYVLAYHSWLQHPPKDGPGEGSRRQMEFEMGNRDVQRKLLQMLRNQLDGLAKSSQGAAELRQALQDEIEAMKADSRRLPWQDGLPASLQNSLEPFRERLEATYNPVTNAFELSRNRKKGSWSFTTE